MNTCLGDRAAHVHVQSSLEPIIWMNPLGFLIVKQIKLWAYHQTVRFS